MSLWKGVGFMWLRYINDLHLFGEGRRWEGEGVDCAEDGRVEEEESAEDGRVEEVGSAEDGRVRR